jgi:hypothetical protein
MKFDLKKFEAAMRAKGYKPGWPEQYRAQFPHSVHWKGTRRKMGANFDAEYSLRKAWCDREFGGNCYFDTLRRKNRDIGKDFMFATEADAVLFRLRFG